MSKKLAHTIRFDPADKLRLLELAEQHGHGFQTECDLAIKQYLKDRRVVLFLERVRCNLEARGLGDQMVMMAKIANLLEIDLE